MGSYQTEAPRRASGTNEVMLLGPGQAQPQVWQWSLSSRDASLWRNPQGTSARVGFLLSHRGERNSDVGSLSLNTGRSQSVSVHARTAPAPSRGHADLAEGLLSLPGCSWGRQLLRMVVSGIHSIASPEENPRGKLYPPGMQLEFSQLSITTHFYNSRLLGTCSLRGSYSLFTVPHWLGWWLKLHTLTFPF